MRLSPPVIDQHRKFWNLIEVDRPLIDFFCGGVFAMVGLEGALQDGLLKPETIIPEIFEKWYRSSGYLVPQIGELYNTAFPFASINWMEGIMGCPIKVSLETYSVGAVEGFLEDFTQLDAISDAALDPNNPWRKKLLEFQKFLVETFGADRSVGFPIMRGPTDLAGAMLGGDRMVFEFKDHPGDMERLLEICAKVWIQTARELTEITPPFQEGYSSYRLLNDPKPSPVLQEDNVAFLSPGWYRDFVLPLDRLILKEFGGSFFHTHSSSFHILIDDIMQCPEVIAIDSCWDLPPFGPPVADLIPYYHRIQEAGKALYILAVGCPEEEELLALSELSPTGLCICFEAHDEDTGQHLTMKLRSAWEE
jgi:hypothetical protein